jgi:tetratricopeptide (TPR) repeat protein
MLDFNLSSFRILNDNEVKDIKGDLLSYTHYANKIKHIILTAPSSLSIGIFGEWGSGKTSLMNLLTASIKEDEQKRENIGVKTVWINIWNFDCSDDELPNVISKKILSDLEYNEDFNINCMENFKSLVNEQLKKLNYEKLVILIDDIDRCFSSRIFKFLKIMAQFLEIDNIVTIISVDRDSLVKSIMQQYDDASYNWGSYYLDKLIQVQFNIPPISRQNIVFDYIKKLDVDEADEYYEFFVGYSNNPRTIKRIINSFELKCQIMNEKKIVYDKMILARICALEHKYPEFYSYLLKYPNLIKNIIEYKYKPNIKTNFEGIRYVEKYHTDNELINFLQGQPNLSKFNLESYLYLRDVKPVDYSDIQRKAQETFGARNYSKAIKYFSELIRMGKKNSEIFFRRGYSLYAMSEYDMAIDDYTNSIKLRPDYKNAHYNLALCYENKKDYLQAVECYKKCLEIDPKGEKYYYRIGLCYEDYKSYDKGIEAFKSCIKLNKNYEYSYYHLGLCYEFKKDYDMSILYYLRGLKINPNNLDINYGLGLCYYYSKDYLEAIEYFIKCVEIDPNYSSAYEFMGTCYSNLNKFEEAAKCFTKVIQNNAYNYNTLIKRGFSLKKMHKFQLSFKDYLKGVELDANESVLSGLEDLLKLMIDDNLKFKNDDIFIDFAELPLALWNKDVIIDIVKGLNLDEFYKNKSLNLIDELFLL